MTDPLTGLRNHRAFQEDLARELGRVGRTGEPLALALLDVDDLKLANDADGHQAGDERLQALADAIRATQRATDCGYRIGGDEFAVILPGARALGAWSSPSASAPARRDGAEGGPAFTATAGVAEALALRSRDELVREADLALIGAKRVRQDVAIYGPDLETVGRRRRRAPTSTTRRTLASALAHAVDAKDSYTRSHCQTVSQLAATVAAELGFTGERLGRMRLAGLLHDVGKIGVPDAILNKPAKLTDGEYAVMQRHALLGADIVRAADLPIEARWVRHHHERYDGGGYPDGLCGDGIPLESRIILVADAFEAMTSDRPYRRAPGEEFAIAELRRNAGTQFDPGGRRRAVPRARPRRGRAGGRARARALTPDNTTDRRRSAGESRRHDRRLRRLRGRGAPRGRSRPRGGRAGRLRRRRLRLARRARADGRGVRRRPPRVQPPRARRRGRGRGARAPEARGLRRDAVRRAEDRPLHRPRGGHPGRADHAVRQPAFIISVRHGDGDLRPVREAIEKRPDLLRCGPGAILHAIIDRVVDDYEPAVQGLEIDIQQVEEQVFSSDAAQNPAQRIYRLEREVLEMQRAVGPLATPGRPARPRPLRSDLARAARLLPRRPRPPHPGRRAGSRASATCSAARSRRT